MLQAEPRAQRAEGNGRLSARLLDGRSRLATFYQQGAAKIRLPKTFTREMEAVLINTAGGMTGGDCFAWDIEAGAGTEITATTQACEKLYKAEAGTARIETRLTAGESARIHWLPQETILFDRASLSRSLTVDLAATAEFLAVEAVVLGRTAMGEQVLSGHFSDRWRIRRAGRLIHAEDLRLSGDFARFAASPAALRGSIAFASLFYTAPDAEAQMVGLRRLLGDAAGGVSCWNGKIVGRLVASSGFELRKVLIPLLSHLRKDASVPKVWTL